MAVSVSGLATLIALILIGPLIYAVHYLFWVKYPCCFCCRRRRQQKGTDEEGKGGDCDAIDKGADEKDLQHPPPEQQTHQQKRIESSSEDDDDQEHHLEHSKELSTSQYMFGLIGYAIGIGNIWRYPYVIAQNGGSAALVAYFVCLILVALPLFLYEMIIGQYVRLSTIRTYSTIRPRWQSFGYAAFGMLFAVMTYYALVVAYTFPYIAASCQDPLPWSVDGMTAEKYWNEVVLNRYEDIDTDPPGRLGPIQWNLAASLCIFWIITLLSASFGKEILAKVTYVTVILPVVLLIILVVQSAFLEGAREGIEFYIGKFDAHKLRDPTVWSTACSQILFSLSPGFGTAITYSSYTDKKEDVYRIGVITAVANSLFSFTGGFAVFSIVGHLAWQEGSTVEEVASKSGTGLAFITIAEAMTHFPASIRNVASVMFFMMLLLLGLDSGFAWVETLTSILEDSFLDAPLTTTMKNMISSTSNHLTRQQKNDSKDKDEDNDQEHAPESEDQSQHPHRRHHYIWNCWKNSGERPPTWAIMLGLAIVQFLLGLFYCTRIGNYLLDVVDHYCGTTFLLLVCCIESVMINIDFTWQRLAFALKQATIGNRRTPNGRTLFPRWLCRVDFHVTVPIATGALFLLIVVDDIRVPYGDYPRGLQATGWSILAILIAVVPLTLWKRDPGTLIPMATLDQDNGKPVQGPQSVEDEKDDDVEQPLQQVEETHSGAPDPDPDPDAGVEVSLDDSPVEMKSIGTGTSAA